MTAFVVISKQFACNALAQNPINIFSHWLLSILALKWNASILPSAHMSRNCCMNDKQCWPRSDTVQCSIWSWFILFVQACQTGLIDYCVGFNDTSTLGGHFMSSPREREKRNRRESRRDERKKQERKRNEETKEIKTFPLCPYLLQG